MIKNQVSASWTKLASQKNIQSEMKEPRYKPFSPLNIKWSELCDQYRRIVKKICTKEEYKERDFVEYMKQRKWEELPAIIKTTAKTHKYRGNMKMIILHSSPKQPFKVLAQWVSRKLEEVVYDWGSILRNTEQLIDQLKDLSLKGDEVLLRLDVSEFFMSGKIEELTNDATDVVLENKDILKEAVAFLLDNQYVKLPACTRVDKKEKD